MPGLDDVDWSALHHAYGPATDVPALLRTLRSEDAKARQNALWELYGNIFHQGTRWIASKSAVPFLADLAVDQSVPERHKIVDLLLHLAVGYPEDWLATGVDTSEFESGEALLARGENESFVDERDVYDAVCAEASRLASLLDDPDTAVRHSASQLLGFLPDAASVTLDRLVAAYAAEAAASLRASHLLSIGMICQAGGLDDPIGFESALSSDEKIERFAAAVSVLRVDGPGRDEAAAVLADFISSPSPDELAWNEGDTVGLASIILSASPMGLDSSSIDRLCELAAGLNGPDAETHIASLLRSVFPDGPTSVPQLASDLGPEQRKVVELLADNPNVWQWQGMEYGNISYTIAGYGLPSSSEGCTRYLNGAPLEARTR